MRIIINRRILWLGDAQAHTPAIKNYTVDYLNKLNNPELLQHQGAKGLLQLMLTAFLITVKHQSGKYTQYSHLL